MISSMIDTVSFGIGIDHQEWYVRQTKRHKGGEIDAISKTCFAGYCRFTVPGAYGSTATVHSRHNYQELDIECSPAKFLTGQNLFGSEDLLRQVLKVARLVCKHLGIRPSKTEIQAIREGRVRLQRLDFTSHVQFETPGLVVAAIKALKQQLAFADVHEVSFYRNETLYIGQHSDTKTLKFYDKGRELVARPLAADHPHRAFVSQAATGLLRVELTLRRRRLQKLHLGEVRDWDADRARALLRQELVDLNLQDQKLLVFRPQDKLSPQRNFLLAAHMSGVDVEQLELTPRALKSAAKAIAAVTGIDIRIPFSGEPPGVDLGLPQLADRLGFGVDPSAVAAGVVQDLPGAPKPTPPSNARQAPCPAPAPSRRGLRCVTRRASRGACNDARGKRPVAAGICRHAPAKRRG